MQNKVVRIRSVSDAKLTEKYIFEAIKPGGFADAEIPIPNLKDQLAWMSWANLRRPEQPSFIVKKGGKIIAGIFGEPTESWFDKGESEIQLLLVTPGEESEDIYFKLLTAIINYYKKWKAKQAHFWVSEELFNKNKITDWHKVAMDSFGFAFKGFKRNSKWSGKPICKIEKIF